MRVQREKIAWLSLTDVGREELQTIQEKARDARGSRWVAVTEFETSYYDKDTFLVTF